MLPCPGYNLSMHGCILKLFGPNVLLGKTMCQDLKHVHSVKVKVINWGQRLQRGTVWCFRGLTPSYIDGFSNYSSQLFFFAKRCVVCKTHVHILNVKVTIWGQRQKKSCPEHIFYSTSARITKHGVWVHLRMAKCWILFRGRCDLTLWPQLPQTSFFTLLWPCSCCKFYSILTGKKTLHRNIALFF